MELHRLQENDAVVRDLEHAQVRILAEGLEELVLDPSCCDYTLAYVRNIQLA